MAGIYVHIPFCKQKCNYCDFYSCTNYNDFDELIKSEIAELRLRKGYINNEVVNTIYFGGGTPSLLPIKYIKEILSCIQFEFKVSDKCEITFEVNPDDLSEEYFFQLYSCGVNRLSVGVQSFNDGILKFLGRRHDSSNLINVIEIAKKVGFKNISVDLIFGIPGMELSVYNDSLNRVLQLDIQHISAYCLSVEKSSFIYKQLINHIITELKELEVLDQFNLTIDRLSESGFYQYEISNYAKEGFESRHNSSYWENVSYLGIGPAAHSYNGFSRQWNVSDIQMYCFNIAHSLLFYDVEFLSDFDNYNEYIMTGLRTSLGISKRYIKDNFYDKIYQKFSEEVNRLISDDLIIFVEDRVKFTRRGMMISDYIFQRLYFIS